MRLDEITITESFSDLRRILGQQYTEKFGSADPDKAEFKSAIDEQELRSVTALMNVLTKAQRLDGEVPDKMSITSSRGMLAAVRHATQKMSQSLDPKLKDTGHWIRLARSENWIVDFTKALTEVYQLYIGRLTDPAKEAPDMDVVAETDAYEIYRLNNYAAARKLCNQHGMTWCTGSSNPQWFSDYGDQVGREHYAVRLPDDSFISVQSGNSGFLITTQDNRYEYGSFDGEGRADVDQVAAQIHGADMEPSEIRDMLAEILSPKYLEMASEKLAPVPVKVFDVSSSGGRIEVVFQTQQEVKKSAVVPVGSSPEQLMDQLGSNYRIMDSPEYLERILSQ